MELELELEDIKYLNDGIYLEVTKNLGLYKNSSLPLEYSLENVSKPKVTRSFIQIY